VSFELYQLKRKCQKNLQLIDGGYQIHYSYFDDHMLAAGAQTSMTKIITMHSLG
jgi:hypothetical protein